MEEATRECKRLRATAREEATEIKAVAEEVAEKVKREAREERAALEEEKAAMENAHTFQKNRILLDVGGRALHSSTFQLLDLSRFVTETPPN